MKLTILCDNNTFIDQYYLGEPALCFYIETGNDRILFDTGYSDVFMINAEKMGIDLSQINKIVLSHGHNDHTGGLVYYLREKRNVEIIAHPDTFIHREDETGVISSPLSAETIGERARLRLTKEPYEVSQDLLYLGEIPVSCDFEERVPIGRNENGEADYLPDDSALVYQGKDGLFIITGCSHSGICNIIEYAKKVTGVDRIKGVIGGFHLLKEGERLDHTVSYLKKENIRELYPCHCVSLKARIAMAKEMTIQETGTGLSIDME
ncbi:MAG: MBL fold metallo-hydrolase [Erysipelotrichaceae bacterium]|nr:MBL fold metallo-hydrolase [Erysipelotrichaceae bacterium]